MAVLIYSGDPKTGHVWFSNVNFGSVLERRSDLECSAITIQKPDLNVLFLFGNGEPFEIQTQNVRFSNGFEQNGSHYVKYHSKSEIQKRPVFE